MLLLEISRGSDTLYLYTASLVNPRHTSREVSNVMCTVNQVVAKVKQLTAIGRGAGVEFEDIQREFAEDVTEVLNDALRSGRLKITFRGKIFSPESELHAIS